MSQRIDKNAIPKELINFDYLPDSSNVRLPVVKAIIGCSDATVWRLVNSGALTARKLSERVTSFNVGQLRRYVASKGSVK